MLLIKICLHNENANETVYVIAQNKSLCNVVTHDVMSRVNHKPWSSPINGTVILFLFTIIVYISTQLLSFMTESEQFRAFLLPDSIWDEQLCSSHAGRGVYVIGIIVGPIESVLGLTALACFLLCLEHGISDDCHAFSYSAMLRLDKGLGFSQCAQERRALWR